MLKAAGSMSSGSITFNTFRFYEILYTVQDFVVSPTIQWIQCIIVSGLPPFAVHMQLIRFMSFMQYLNIYTCYFDGVACGTCGRAVR